ncbi:MULTISPECIES: DUF2849 domain-containing protein [Pacificibacter]|uniref:DUF2849 domain-containing protein n=1 Tax=Pacificibacter TaxID=1042323 RepID=UPI001C084CFC|nr:MULTISPECIES: DUF2849 domain-containing protein [Pacificibacter]MBU2936215.1 DUF2849 domain-containing protein [Pacificibacter marinus]MDO6616792.1 DUF2849 domain-containing protein [Pacificibacter sp. 1_MG-2023]
MARPFTPKIVTANALLEGDVIYLSASDTWVRALSDAALFDTQEVAEERLAFAAKDGFAVGAYLVDAVAGENGPEPTHFREDFRRTGPSNHNHGKQAEL